MNWFKRLIALRDSRRVTMKDVYADLGIGLIDLIEARQMSHAFNETYLARGYSEKQAILALIRMKAVEKLGPDRILDAARPHLLHMTTPIVITQSKLDGKHSFFPIEEGKVVMIYHYDFDHDCYLAQCVDSRHVIKEPIIRY